MSADESTVTLTPTSSVPLGRPFVLERPVRSGRAVAGKRVHGQPVVVNVKTASAPSALPLTSVTEPARRAVNEVAAASGVDGWSVAVFVVPSYETVAATFEPPAVGASVNVDAVIVPEVIPPAKVIVTGAPRGAPVAPASGAVETTWGPLTVKLHEKALARVAPSGVAICFARCAVYVTPACRGEFGVSTARLCAPS